MIRCYFTNLEDVAISELKKAKKSIKAAVAWINFSIYGELLKELLDRNIKIKILLNNDGVNQRYLNDIQYLNSIGANIRLVNFTGIMHHKFCIIDKQICMFGSFNWTQNANIRNIEDLNICDEPSFVNNYLLEFKALWDLSKTDIKLLRNPQRCEVCQNPIINILFMEQEGYNETKIDVMQQCECGQRIVYTDFYDISVYNNYLAAVDKFDDDIAMAQQSGDEILYYQLVAQQDFVIANYLSIVRANRMGLPIIHAVGVKSWEWYNKHEGDFVYKIIWKERGTEQYVEDEYPIE
ncbi:MAG: phospholipase D-like domain-containing protein [Clostridium sp.]